MADVTIVASQQVPTVAPTGGQQAQGSQAQGLSPGTLVSGTIAGKDASGNYLLKSPQGTFTLQSSTPLTYNSDVTIRIGAGAAGNTAARIITVNGEPFSEFSAPQPAESDSVSEALLPQAVSEPTQPAAAPGTFRGVVVSAPPQAPAEASQALTQGAQVVVRLASDQSETGQQSQTPSPAPQTPAASAPASASVAAEPQQTAQVPVVPAVQPAPAPQINTTATSVPAPAAAAPVETELAPAQAVAQTEQAGTPQPSPQQAAPQQAAPAASETPAAQPQAAATPTPSTPVSALYNVYTKQSAANPTAAATPAAPSAPSSPQAPAGIPAQVVSADENGTVALSTPQGTVTVQASALPSAFTAGTSVTIELPQLITAQNAAPSTLGELAGSWQSLKDIISVVNNANPQAATALLARLPQLGPDFLASSTSFMTSLLQGDARKLLGDDTLDTLRESGRQDLIDRFSGEMANLSGTFSTAQARQQPGGWQMMLLPFVFQEAVQQARIYVKREPPKKERSQAKSSNDTRFVVEVDLSELGPMQMDGLVRKKEQNTAFDLVIRSHHAFDSDMQAEISGIYASAAELTGFKGTVAFQVTRDFTVKPLEETGEETHAITV